MTLDQLRIFVAVAERQHVTQAARALNLAQSAASHGIAALEARYGATLFNRVGRRIELTDAGRAFLVEARAILDQVDRAERMLGAFGGLERGTLKVQASQTIAGYWLPPRLVAFRQAYPGIEVRLGIGNTAQVAAAVRDGEAEFGFVEGAIDNDSLASMPVAADDLVIVVAPGHPWCECAPRGVEDLPNSPWVLREVGSGTRSFFEQALTRLGLDPARLTVEMDLPSNEAVRSAVAAGLGATAISASVAAPAIEAGLLHHVPLRVLPQRMYHGVWQGQRLRSRIVTAFLETLERPRGRSEASGMART